MTVSPFRTFELYVILKRYFNGNFDVFKYKFKSNLKYSSFDKRRDKYIFTKLGKKFENEEELINFYVSNFIFNDKWVGDLNEEHYKIWKRKNQSLSYLFRSEMEHVFNLSNDFKGSFEIKNGQMPLIIREYLSGDISIETLSILDKFLKFTNVADKKITDTIIWPEVKNKINKYTPFINFNCETFKKIIKEVYTL